MATITGLKASRILGMEATLTAADAALDTRVDSIEAALAAASEGALVWKGGWDTAVEYKTGEVVYDTEGAIWVATGTAPNTLDTPAATQPVPTITISSNTYYRVPVDTGIYDAGADVSQIYFFFDVSVAGTFTITGRNNAGAVWTSYYIYAYDGSGAAITPANNPGFGQPYVATLQPGRYAFRIIGAYGHYGRYADVVRSDGAEFTTGSVWTPLRLGRIVQDEGTSRPLRKRLNFVGTGVSATDDAANDRTNVTINGGFVERTKIAKTADFTLTATEDHATVLCSKTTEMNIKVDAEGWTSTPIPFECEIINQNAGPLRLWPGTGAVTIRQPGNAEGNLVDVRIPAYGRAMLYKHTSNSWIIVPIGVAPVIREEGAQLTRRGSINFIGAGVTAEDDAANDRTNVTIPGAGSVYQVTALGVPPATNIPNNGANTPIPWGAEAIDQGGWHDNVTNPSRVTVVAGGVYRLVANVVLAAGDTTGNRWANFRKNGTDVIGGQSGPPQAANAQYFSLAATVSLAAGDYVEVTAAQNSGVADVAIVPAQMNFSVERIA